MFGRTASRTTTATISRLDEQSSNKNDTAASVVRENADTVLLFGTAFPNWSSFLGTSNRNINNNNDKADINSDDYGGGGGGGGDDHTIVTVCSNPPGQHPFQQSQPELQDCPKLVRFGSVRIHCHPLTATKTLPALEPKPQHMNSDLREPDVRDDDANVPPSSITVDNGGNTASRTSTIDEGREDLPNDIDDDSDIPNENLKRLAQRMRRRNRIGPFLTLEWTPTQTLRFASIETYDNLRSSERIPAKQLRISQRRKNTILLENQQLPDTSAVSDNYETEDYNNSNDDEDCSTTRDAIITTTSSDAEFESLELVINESEYFIDQVAKDILHHCRTNRQQQLTIQSLEEEGFVQLVAALQNGEQQQQLSSSSGHTTTNWHEQIVITSAGNDGTTFPLQTIDTMDDLEALEQHQPTTPLTTSSPAKGRMSLVRNSKTKSNQGDQPKIAERNDISIFLSKIKKQSKKVATSKPLRFLSLGKTKAKNKDAFKVPPPPSIQTLH